MSLQVGKLSKKDLFSWILTAVLPIFILILPNSEMFNKDVKTFLIITVIAILAFCFEHIPMAVAAILLPVFYTAFGIATPATSFSAWSHNLVWLVFGGLVFADVLTNVGFAKRLAYKCIILTGCSYAGVIWGITISALILTLLIPSNAAFPLVALTYGICTALGFGKSRESAGIMMAAVIASQMPWCFMFYPYTLVMFSAGEGVTGPINFSWMDYIINNGPGVLFLFIMITIIIKLCKPSAPFKNKEYFQNEYKSLGAMGIKEKKTMVISILLFLSMLTADYHGIAIGWCFLFFACSFFLPGINVGTTELKNANFIFPIFIASCMTIGNVGASLGIGNIVADLVTPILEGKSITFVLMFAWLVATLVNFLLTPMAIIAAFAMPFAQIAINLGINPICVYFAMINGMDQLLLPYEYANYLLYFSFGLIYLKDFAKIMGIKMVLNFAFMMLVMIPYWKFIGFAYL